MGVETYLSYLCPILIQHRQSTTPVPDVNVFGRGVETDIVRIIAKLDGFDCFVRTSIKQAQRAVISVGDVQSVHVRQIEHALRLMQTGNAVYAFSARDVDHFDSI